MPKRMLTLALLAVAGGCAQDPVVPRLGDDPITLALSVSSRSIQRGAPDTITVVVTNTLTQSVRLRYGYGEDCHVEIRIRNAAGDVVLPPGGQKPCLPVNSILDIAAGASITRRFIWDGRTTFLPTTSTDRLPVGSYFVSAEINALNYSAFVPAIKVDLTP